MHTRDTSSATIDRPARGGLIEKLEATRLDMRAFRRARWVLRTALIVLLLAGVLAAADWLLILGVGVRAVGLLMICGVAVALLVRGLLLRGRFSRPDVPWASRPVPTVRSAGSPCKAP
jgi:hypothetical protein